MFGANVKGTLGGYVKQAMAPTSFLLRVAPRSDHSRIEGSRARPAGQVMKNVRHLIVSTIRWREEVTVRCIIVLITVFLRHKGTLRN